MNPSLESTSAAASGNKSLWAVIGVLGVAVVAMGGYLLQGPTRPVGSGASAVPALVAAPATTTAPAASLTEPQVQPAKVPVANAPVESPMITETKDGTPVTPKKAAAPVKPATVASKAAPQPTPAQSSAANPATTPSTPMGQGSQATPTPQVAQTPTALPPPPKPVCLSCGTITSVTPIQRDGTGSGAGAVAGGVLGGVLGNQVGGGDGKTIATILGAIGGGMAGNAVEKKMKKETVYQVNVRMEDGTMRSFEQATPTSVGAKVVVEGDAIRPAN